MQRRAIGAYFSVDDLAHFERARGLLPGATTLWRFLSNQVYMEASLAGFGADPRPYHVLNWLCHGLNVGLLFVLARALGAGRLAAVLAAGLFGASRVFLPALFQAIGLGELAALAGALVAIRLVLEDRPLLRVAAMLSFTIALLAKESVAFLPAVLLVTTGRAEPLRARWNRAAPLLAIGTLYFAYLVLGHARTLGARGEAYGIALGANLFHNLMTYTVWATDLAHPIPDPVTTIDPQAWRAGSVVLLGLAALALAATPRTRLPWAGLSWFVLGLLPVLPILHHSYAYYLYAPAVGLALAVGSAFEAVFPHRTAWAVVVVSLLGYAWRSDALIADRVRLRVPGSDLALDPFLRKSEVARALATSLEPSIRGRSSIRAFVYKPDLGSRFFAAGTGRELSAEQTSGAGVKYDLDLEVLDRGRALMALYPELDTLVIGPDWTPDLVPYELYVLSHRSIVPMGRGAEGLERIVETLVANGHPELARPILERALTAYPNSPSLRRDLASLTRQAGPLH